MIVNEKTIFCDINILINLNILGKNLYVHHKDKKIEHNFEISHSISISIIYVANG